MAKRVLIAVHFAVLTVYSRYVNKTECADRFNITTIKVNDDNKIKFLVNSTIHKDGPVDQFFYLQQCKSEWHFGFNHSIYGWQSHILTNDKAPTNKMSSVQSGQKMSANNKTYISIINYGKQQGGTLPIRDKLKLNKLRLTTRHSGIYWLSVGGKTSGHCIANFSLAVNSTGVSVNISIMDNNLTQVDPRFLEFSKTYAIVCIGEGSPKLPQVSLERINCSRKCENDNNEMGISETRNGTFDRSQILWVNATEPVSEYQCIASRNICDIDKVNDCQKNTSIRLYVSDIPTESKGVCISENDQCLIEQQNTTEPDQIFHPHDYYNFTCKVQKNVYTKNITMEVEYFNGTVKQANNLIWATSEFSYTIIWPIGPLTVAHSGIYACIAEQIVPPSNTTKQSGTQITPTPIVKVFEKRTKTINVIVSRPQDDYPFLKPTIITLTSLLIFMVIIFGGLTFIIQQRKKRHIKQIKKSIDSTRKECMESLLFSIKFLEAPKQFYISGKRLTIGHELGRGNFGKVFESKLAYGDDSITVAAKVPLDRENPKQMGVLRDEVEVMSKIDYHPNVLGLIGIVVDEGIAIVEYCQLGSLRDYVIEHSGAFLNEIHSQLTQIYMQPPWQTATTIYKSETDPKWSIDTAEMKTANSLPTSELLDYSYQIANGMCFLNQNNIIHRDLALRNALLTRNRIVKLADFGLARSINVYLQSNESITKIPIRTTAIESIRQGIFTTRSDVWSYGVLMWELFSLGAQPYSNLVDADLNKIATYLDRGDRLIKPVRAPNEIYRLMRQCWQENPFERPSFLDCLSMVGQELNRCSKPTLNEVIRKLSEKERQKTIETYENWRSLSESSDQSSYYNLNSVVNSIDNKPGPMRPMRSDSVELISL